jgi:serine/threonine-protein kinase
MASVMAMKGNLAEAKALFEKIIPLKEKTLGPDHPDLAYTLDDLGWVLSELGHPEQSIALHDRAISILVNHSDPSNPVIANAYGNKGDSLRKVGRYADAEQSFARAMEILEASDDKTPYLATTLTGIGEAKLAQNQPAAAIPYLERALETYAQFPGSGAPGADAQFALARALWSCGRDRKRARSLATTALETYRDVKRTEREKAIEAWLSSPPRPLCAL